MEILCRYSVHIVPTHHCCIFHVFPNSAENLIRKNKFFPLDFNTNIITISSVQSCIGNVRRENLFSLKIVLLVPVIAHNSENFKILMVGTKYFEILSTY